MSKKFLTIDGRNEVTRLSRWITIKQAYNITSSHSLYSYTQDENGYTPGGDNYNPVNGNSLDYFNFRGRKYAISQFVALGSVWCGGAPYKFIDNDNSVTFIHAVDFSGDLYDPLYIELDNSGERVRVYSVKNKGVL